ncbi:hypothetical protein [Listeria newyorkensis]|uniref:hypothetical protein n=1 Tax=Listeria newyorkensis TaxID=1497681 RepID=UPI00051E13FF|nr:hypothetical protein [Listeria newyorkensis]KGL43581.1 hypothetical protein EP58_07525 [Listeria newyorkensis]
MKKGLSRLLLVMIAIAMIVSTIPAYEPHAEQEVPPADGIIEGTPEQTEVAEEQTGADQTDKQVVEDENTEVSSTKVDGDWKDPYYEGKRMLRSVQDKPEKATIKTVSNGVGTGTGAMNLSWKAMPGATGYKVIIGNGYNYEYFTVGNVTSWTTKGKGIFPTKAELDKGLYRFHTDGKGTEFANDPTQLYENTFKAGTTWTLRGQKKYIVRILAIYASGDGPTSDITEAVMPPETLPAKPEKSTIKTTSSGAGTGTGHMDISWQAVSGAIDYKVVISNGYNYEYFNTGNVTNWSTKGKNIFPTQAEIANKQYKFHQDGKGVEFASDPRALYENGYQAGSTFGLRNQKKYIVRILAVYPWGDGPTSDITDAIMPIEQMAKPTVTSYRSEEDASKGYLDVSWQPVADAISYKVGLFNGFNYQYVNVGKTTNWSTKGKKLWASKTDIANGNYQLHTDGTGSELPMDPMQTYIAANKANPNVNYSDRLFYYTRVVAVFADQESPVSEAGVVTMPLEDLSFADVESTVSDNQGSFTLRWGGVANAAGYKVWLSDGYLYNGYDVGENYEWTSKDKGIWPTNQEIINGFKGLHHDNKGQELSSNPSEVYKVNNPNFANTENYYARITAYDANGETIALQNATRFSLGDYSDDEQSEEVLPLVIEGEIVSLDQLPDDMKSEYLMDGFTDEDEFFLAEVYQTGGMARKANVVWLSGSTKRENATLAYTKYLIRSSNSPLFAASTQIQLGTSVKTTSNVSIYGKPYAFSGGVYSTYTGKKNYFTAKAVSRITTGMGTVSAWKTVGGVTLGK